MPPLWLTLLVMLLVAIVVWAVLIQCLVGHLHRRLRRLEVEVLMKTLVAPPRDDEEW